MGLKKRGKGPGYRTPGWFKGKTASQRGKGKRKK
jgi:hypothetical protein